MCVIRCEPMAADLAASVAAAFPGALRADVCRAAAAIPGTRPASPFTVLVYGEPVVIPYRVYGDEPTGGPLPLIVTATTSALIANWLPSCVRWPPDDGCVRL